MGARPSFQQEVSNLLYASESTPMQCCIQCATCVSTCPAAEFMDASPRRIIAMIAADMKDAVLASNSYWYCASCYHCSAKCPRGIDVAGMMYALKRYSLWKGRHREGLIGPDFSRRFVKMIMKTGRAYEPSLAPAFLGKYGWRVLLGDVKTALRLLSKGRLPLLPSRIKRVRPFRRMLARIIPLGGVA